MDAKQEYIDRVSKTYSRQELLKSCRMIGLSAHQIKSSKKLAELLYRNKEGIK